jgi:hypothetical protein
MFDWIVIGFDHLNQRMNQPILRNRMNRMARALFQEQSSGSNFEFLRYKL